MVGAWVRSGGRVRTYELLTPPDLVGPAPLLIVLHGLGDRGRGIRTYSGFDGAAGAQGYEVYRVRNWPEYESTEDFDVCD